MAEKLPIARSQLLKAKTNVNLQYFLAKNLQINIIRNSFDTLGVLEKNLINQSRRDAKFSMYLSEVPINLLCVFATLHDTTN